MEKKKVINLRLTQAQHAQLKKEAGRVPLHRHILYLLFEKEFQEKAKLICMCDDCQAERKAEAS